jgi:hypothetical protein
VIRRTIRTAAATGALAVALGLAAPASTQQAGGTLVARYTLDAGTMSGMAGMGAGGGMGAAMAMLRGEANAGARELRLRLGSTRTATGAPKGDHFIPSSMAMGASLPLYTPPRRPDEPLPRGFEQPRGRLLLYWGCGERAGPGQPVVIDFAKVARGQLPPGLMSQGANLPDDWEITQTNSTTYGEWPNPDDVKQVPSRASLRGAHRIASAYAPEIKFDLDQDFMAALNVQSSAMASGAYGLRWNAVPGATGYYAWVVSAKDDGRGGAGDVVWWSSSSKQAFGGPLWDWISPAAAARLIQDGTVLPPSRQECTVPAEVKQAGGEVMMAQMTAFGPQRDFSHPARPANARANWQPEWIARARFRATSMVILGMDMEGMMGGRSSSASEPEARPAKPKCKGLGGIAKRAAGLCE